MEGICEKCGLPKNICVCTQITKEAQKIKVQVVKRMFGKYVTLVSGLENEQEAKNLAKQLKKKFACGGTQHGTSIELQGGHKDKVFGFLLKEGYKADQIDA